MTGLAFCLHLTSIKNVSRQLLFLTLTQTGRRPGQSPRRWGGDVLTRQICAGGSYQRAKKKKNNRIEADRITVVGVAPADWLRQAVSDCSLLTACSLN